MYTHAEKQYPLLITTTYLNLDCNDNRNQLFVEFLHHN